jgi:fructosamine-3-kinase
VIVAGVELHDVHPVAGGDVARAFRGIGPDGAVVFAKTLDEAPDGFFPAEAAGLERLGRTGTVPVPDVVAVDEDGLVLQWVTEGAPQVSGAESFGRALAALHATSAPAYGAEQEGFIGSLPLPNASAEDWPTFYVERRLRPFMAALGPDERRAVDAVCASIDRLAGPIVPPALLHGDLWSGNLLWGDDGQVWLVDAAAAHWGHPETDLAMLALFGAPHLDVILSAYQSVSPLPDGWRRRVALHQLHPLLVHATMFGAGWGTRAAHVARAALSNA